MSRDGPLRWDAHGVLWFTPPPAATDDAGMRRLRAQLRMAIEERRQAARVRVLFDLRDCPLGLPQLHFTLRTLWRHEAYMREALERSVALVPHSAAVKALCDLFLYVYAPVRPFSIEIDEAAALAFVLGG